MNKYSTAQVIHIEPARSCETCGVRKLCLPMALESRELEAMGSLVKGHPHLKPNEYIYHAGDRFRCLYAIKSGAIKTFGLTRDGKEQITGFHLPGELVGMDAIGGDTYNCNAVALQDTELCQLPFRQLEELAGHVPRLQHELTSMLGREINAEGRMLLMIGRMTAEQRVACFLKNLFCRLRQRGAEVDGVLLPMSREDIGNYLGLTLETVSRRLSILQKQRVIEIDKRSVRFLDLSALSRLCVS